jgi:hypothetical protein
MNYFFYFLFHKTMGAPQNRWTEAGSALKDNKCAHTIQHRDLQTLLLHFQNFDSKWAIITD